MSLIEFKNLPDTSTPISAENLNNNFEYLDEKNELSSDEKIIGKWIDGKPIYRKVINTGTLPNTTTKTVAHDITNLKRIINITGYAYSSSLGVFYTLPHVHHTNVVNQVSVYVSGSNITIGTGLDRSAFTESYIILEYTKLTD